MRRGWILLPAALLLAGCGGNSNKPQAASTGTGTPAQTISLSEKEFSLTPRSISLAKPGTYAFEVTNDGQIPHALEVEGHGAEQKTGTIQPGSSATLMVNLTANGSYEVYCPIDDHRSKGMEASLTVGGTAGAGTSTQEHETTTGETTTGQTSTEKKGGYGY
jgi:plastocyanin